MTARKLNIIGELINNSFARARQAYTDRSTAGYQQLAKLQSDAGADYLDVNLDGTQRLQVRPEEMLAFLPDVIRAIQEVTPVPLCFDNPSVDYQRVALESYDAGRSGRPIVNSLAASRDRLEEMIELVAAFDTNVVVMASERFLPSGSAQCLSGEDEHEAAKYWVERLAKEAGRTPDQVLIDPGLAPVGADTYGLVNIGLDAMRMIRSDPDLAGVHFVVGLSNFAWGTPRSVRGQLENAYLTIATELGLDFAIASAGKAAPLPPDHPMVGRLRDALAQGRPLDGESQEVAGFRQAMALVDICREGEPVES